VLSSHKIRELQPRTAVFTQQTIPYQPLCATDEIAIGGAVDYLIAKAYNGELCFLLPLLLSFDFFFFFFENML
jgi:hypothetical protein